LENDIPNTAKLNGKTYEDIIANQYRWIVWAMPKTKDGKID
jgi:type I restriction enzyme M protein